jgi:hypothetical protein
VILVDNNGAFITERSVRFAKSRMGEAEAAYVIMHPIQFRACVEAIPMINVITKDLKEDEIPPTTFTGVQLVQDGYFPRDLIEYRNAQHEVILQIKNLAVPEVSSDQRIGHQG